jgi:phosphopantothenoylcysteine decarboxylase/phosphopantothenate--cysteine ligase
MCAAAIAALPADIFIGVAAVADWRVAPVDQKIKKDGASSAPALTLIENPDILATIASSPQRPALVVGFAAETQNLLSAARDKLIKKGCDMIVANDVGVTSDVFGGETNDVHIIMSAGVESWDKMTKSALADRLIGLIANQCDAMGVN